MIRGTRPNKEFKTTVLKKAQQMLNAGHSKTYVAEYHEVSRPWLNRLLKEAEALELESIRADQHSDQHPDQQ